MNLKLLAFFTLKLRLFLCLTLTFSAAVVKAQYVTIPDTALAKIFQGEFSVCMNGNKLDTTCSVVLKRKWLNFSNPNIVNLDGIQYFDSLEALNIYYFQGTSLPRLPSGLKEFACNENPNLTSLPALPATIINLYSAFNALTTLPDLPPRLLNLDCGFNQITQLPALPKEINYIRCSHNLLTGMPGLPDSLAHFDCSFNLIQSMPALPSKLRVALMEHNRMDSLPPLPALLLQLNCRNNQLKQLPELKNLGYLTLDCSANKLKKMPELPSEIYWLACDSNQLDSIPRIPSKSKLRYLTCSSNQLTVLPVLPSTMTMLDCSHNKITKIPDLPVNTIYTFELHCSNNLLTELPALPNTWMLDCSHNQISELPLLKLMPYNLDCSYNNITCFNAFPDNSNYGDPNVNLSNNPYKCLPNYCKGMDDYSLTLPLCSFDETGVANPYGCAFAVGITGKVYRDSNTNCLHDSTEQGIGNFPIVIKDKNNVFVGKQVTLKNGSFAFNPSPESYTIQIDNDFYSDYISCKYPGKDTMVKLDSNVKLVKNIDFGISCNGGKDLGVQSIYTFGPVFPGRKNTLWVNAGDLSQSMGLTCAGDISGKVTIDVAGKVKYRAPSPGALVPDSVKGNHFVYNISNFGKINNATAFGLEFMTDTNATIGDIVCTEVTVSSFAGEKNISNNKRKQCYPVVNSYDPNIKEVYPVDVPPKYDDWLTYTIHFQNTGTAPAYNIRLADTLDKNLDPETFTVLEYSHAVEVNLKGRALSFRFRDIMLPDSHTNSKGSNGFVQYRIKPKAGLPLGTKIENTAFIYFDYNDPVVTNTTVNSYVNPGSAVKSDVVKPLIKTYPNPSTGQIRISSSYDFELRISDISGKLMLQERNATSVSLPPGLYIFEYTVGGVKLVEKVIVLGL